MLSSVAPSCCRRGGGTLCSAIGRTIALRGRALTTARSSASASVSSSWVLPPEVQSNAPSCTRTCTWGGRRAARPFSSALPLLEVDFADDNSSSSKVEHAHADDGGGCPSVQVIKGGEAVLVRFPPTGSSHDPCGEQTRASAAAAAASTTFDAAWLWSNCPSGILPDSGQRTRTPGQFPGWTIASASILDGERALSDASADATLHLPIPPPPPGSAHPILGNNLFRGVVSESSSSSSSQSKTNQQKLLRVVWDAAPAAPNNGGNIGDDGSDDAGQCVCTSVSYFDISWLQQWRYDELALERRQRRSEITTTIAVPNVEYDTGSGLFEVDYEEIVASSEFQDESHTGRRSAALFALLRSIFTHGAALVTNVPCINDSVSPVVSTDPLEIIGKAIGGGRLSHGALYGDIFHVKSIPSAHNIAYTSQHLAPHQDLAYYESPPGIQLLHCVGSSPTLTGGESVLIDGMAAAERLRQIAPDYFLTLATCPATFVKQRDGACMLYQRPHIVLKEDGSGRDCIDREIVGVNWSPPFEGPLCIGQDRVRSYYRAYAAFEYMLDTSLPMPPPRNHFLSQAEVHEFASYAQENTWENRLQPGQMLVFNNQRMLHGRRGFAVGYSDPSKDVESQQQEQLPGGEVDAKPIRHLIGAYTNIDDTLCRYRVLLQEFDEPLASIPNVGNGTTNSMP
jgi:hypothetical protein